MPEAPTNKKQKQVTIVNPWEEVIGPNIGAFQLSTALSNAGYRVTLAGSKEDHLAQQAVRSGVQFIHAPHLRKLPRTLHIPRLLVSIARTWKVQNLIRRHNQNTACSLTIINSENFLFPHRFGSRNGTCLVIVRGARFATPRWAGKLFARLNAAVNDSTLYIAVSKTVADLLNTVGIPDSAIRIIPNGVDCSRFKPMTVTRGDIIDIPTDATVVGTIAHLVPRKGVHHLLTCFAQVATAHPKTYLVIIGCDPHKSKSADRSYVKKLKSMATNLGIRSRVLFLGLRTDTEQLLNCIDVYVQPSETESFCRTVVEAMACEKPVVCFNVGALSEIVVDGQTGYVITPFDTACLTAKIRELLQNDKLRSRMGKAGRQRAKTLYSLDASLGKYLSLVDCYQQDSR